MCLPPHPPPGCAGGASTWSGQGTRQGQPCRPGNGFSSSTSPCEGASPASSLGAFLDGGPWGASTRPWQCPALLPLCHIRLWSFTGCLQPFPAGAGIHMSKQCHEERGTPGTQLKMSLCIPAPSQLSQWWSARATLPEATATSMGYSGVTHAHIEHFPSHVLDLY